MKKRLLTGLFAVLMLAATGCTGKDNSLLDPKQPVTISVWHYYNGLQKTAFDTLVDSFNNGVGREQGIIVEPHNYGSVTALEESVQASVNQEVGSSALPDVVSLYADTAYLLYQKDLLADLSPYLTAEELAEYVPSYLEEGHIGKEGELVIFPTAKSTEVFMINTTDWDKFADATGASLDGLGTMEGVAKTAEAYYKWTDAQTPDVAGDGKAFFGRDAMANLFIIASQQEDIELFEVKDGNVTLHLDKSVMKRIWDTYYVPYMKGYFKAVGRFRSDDAKIGEIIALVGSSTSASYFPKEVTIGSASYPIDCQVMAAPILEGGKACAVQQGAGMVVTKSSKQAELASATFLKWFTDARRNLDFSATSGYLPVKQSGYDLAMLDEVLAESGQELESVIRETLEVSFDVVKTHELYTNKAFEGGSAARKVLEYHMMDTANANLEAAAPLLAGGTSREEAIASYISDSAFEDWFASFEEALEAAVHP